MSTKHIRTAADLARFKAALKVECRDCGNSITLSGFDVARACGSDDLQSIERRFKCSLCGAKNVRLATLTPPPPRN